MQRVFLSFVIVIAAVVGLSLVSSRLWGGRSEETTASKPLVIDEGMTVAQFGRRNALPAKLLDKVFGLPSPPDRQRLVSDFQMSTFSFQSLCIQPHTL